MATITVKNMSVSYNKGKAFALKDMNLQVKDGEFCVFLGPSGCGKSTAMHCVAGLLKPFRGQILFDDTVMSSDKKKDFVPPQERNIAMVFQEYALYPNMSVRKNMSFALETKKAPKDEITKRVDYMAKMLSIEDLLDRKPAELSGGQRQRVALGRALVRDPQVFLLDEPLGNLDAKLRDQVRYELKKIQAELGITTIYVTHDQTEAMTMADHIVLLKDGQIMQEGSPDDLYDHPKNLFVAGFVGSPQINQLVCTVTETEDKKALLLDSGDFSMRVPETMTQDLQDYVGQKVTVGIRPSDFTLCDSADPYAIETKVDVVETLGDALLFYLTAQSKTLVVKVSGTDEETRKAKTLSLLPGRIHVFDIETGNRIGD